MMIPASYVDNCTAQNCFLLDHPSDPGMLLRNFHSRLHILYKGKMSKGADFDLYIGCTGSG